MILRKYNIPLRQLLQFVTATRETLGVSDHPLPRSLSPLEICICLARAYSWAIKREVESKSGKSLGAFSNWFHAPNHKKKHRKISQECQINKQKGNTKEEVKKKQKTQWNKIKTKKRQPQHDWAEIAGPYPDQTDGRTYWQTRQLFHCEPEQLVTSPRGERWQRKGEREESRLRLSCLLSHCCKIDEAQ